MGKDKTEACCTAVHCASSTTPLNERLFATDVTALLRVESAAAAAACATVPCTGANTSPGQKNGAAVGVTDGEGRAEGDGDTLGDGVDAKKRAALSPATATCNAARHTNTRINMDERVYKGIW